MTIDTHTHAWGPPSPQHPWVNGDIVESVDRFSVDTVYDAEHLLADMDRLRIDEAVVVGYPIVEWTDNYHTMRYAREFDRLYGVVMLDHFGDETVERARDTLSTDGVVGVRIAPEQPYDQMWRHSRQRSDAEPTWLRDAIDETDFWQVLREEESLVTVATGAEGLDQVADLVETYPDLTYLFDAYGPLSANATDDQFEAFARFADHENVGVKVSHTPYVSNEGFPYEDVHDVLRWLLEKFGPERVAWGSDYPNVTQHPDDVTYAEAYNWLYHVERLSDRDLAYLEGKAFESMAGSALE